MKVVTCPLAALLCIASGCERDRMSTMGASTTQPAERVASEAAFGIAPWDATEPPTPDLSRNDQGYLLDLAHRTLEEYLRDGRAYLPAAERESLTRRRHRLLVVLSARGERWATAHTAEGDLPGLVRLGTIEAASGREFQARLRRARESADGAPMADEWQVVLDVAGPRQAIPARTIPELLRVLEPGIHGLGVRTNREEAEVFASEALMHRAGAADMAARVASLVRLSPAALAENGRGLWFCRFRTQTFGDGAKAGEAVTYVRGVRLVRQDEVHHGTLRGAAFAGAGYLTRTQRESGRWAAGYEPARDVWSRESAPFAEALAAWGLSRVAARSARPDHLGAARAALTALVETAVPISKSDASPYLPAEPQQHLGATAAVVAAITELGLLGQLGDLGQERDRLAETLARQVDAAGRLGGPFADAGPREAALAVLTLATLGRESQQEAAERLWRGSTAAWEARTDAETVGWALLAAARLHDMAPKKGYAQQAFALADWLVKQQHRAGAAPARYEDAVGGWPGEGGEPLGAATAAVLVEALAAADQLARRRPDESDAERYARPLALGLRHLLQLQYGAEDGWSVTRPATALGGFRTSLTDRTIECGTTGRALLALAAVLQTRTDRELDQFATAGRGTE
jgi:hypothetical protein